MTVPAVDDLSVVEHEPKELVVQLEAESVPAVAEKVIVTPRALSES